jgi:hypothetical protein
MMKKLYALMLLAGFVGLMAAEGDDKDLIDKNVSRPNSAQNAEGSTGSSDSSKLSSGENNKKADEKQTIKVIDSKVVVKINEKKYEETSVLGRWKEKLKNTMNDLADAASKAAPKITPEEEEELDYILEHNDHKSESVQKKKVRRDIGLIAAKEKFKDIAYDVLSAVDEAFPKLTAEEEKAEGSAFMKNRVAKKFFLKKEEKKKAATSAQTKQNSSGVSQSKAEGILAFMKDHAMPLTAVTGIVAGGLIYWYYYADEGQSTKIK